MTIHSVINRLRLRGRLHNQSIDRMNIPVSVFLNSFTDKNLDNLCNKCQTRGDGRFALLVFENCVTRFGKSFLFLAGFWAKLLCKP